MESGETTLAGCAGFYPGPATASMRSVDE